MASAILGYHREMTRRCIGLLLALVVAGTPVALTVCQFTCAVEATALASRHAEHHSCHAEPATRDARISGAEHVCGHPSDSPAGLEQFAQALDIPAVVVATVAFLPAPAAGSFHTASSRAEHSPPGQLLITTSQLRV